MTRRAVTRMCENVTVMLNRNLPIVVIVISVTVNLLLATKLMRAQQPVATGVAIGSAIESFEGESPEGHRVMVDFRQPTILYYFSPSCSWCERNWSNVRDFVTQTRGRYRFVGISTAAVPEDFLRARQLQIEVAAKLSPETARRYKLNGTPQTIIVSSSGHVLQTWTGAYQGSQAREIEMYFGLSLPGLTSPQTSHRP